MGYPNFLVKRQIERAVASMSLVPGATVLDFGCGEQPYRDIFGSELQYLGADLPGNPLADIEIVGGRIERPNASVDLVLSSQVLEHVAEPDQYLSECLRVLTVDGRLLLTTHGTMFYHPHPTDYWRWTDEGLQQILGKKGFTIESVTPLMGAVPLGIWLAMLNIQRSLPRGLRHVFILISNLIIRLTDRRAWQTYKADFVYVVLARRENMGLVQ